MPDFRRLLDDLWGAFDPDEPLFCECGPDWECPDCALAAPVGPATESRGFRAASTGA